jgi:hypothetical protein
LFAELAAIDQSSGKTAGLRQTKKVNGKRIVENDKSNVMTVAKKKKIAKMRGLDGTKRKRLRKSNLQYVNYVARNGQLKIKLVCVHLMQKNVTRNTVLGIR